MTEVGLIWTCTIVTIVSTALVFVALAQWSAGGPAPWSIVPGLVRGVRGWAIHDDVLPPMRFESPGAFHLALATDRGAVRLPAVDAGSNAPATPGRAAGEAGADAIGAVIEDLETRRI